VNARVLGVALAVALAAVGAVVWIWLHAQFDKARVQDALTTAAPEVLDRLARDSRSPQQVLDDVLRRHHDASVSPIWFDDSSAPIDAWGHRFRVRVDAERPPRWVVCESAGPDSEFGTEDDIASRSDR
jgi:hypothetical protein